MHDKEAVREFTALYDACRMRVWGYVQACAGKDTADEVVSETFVIAWRRFHDIPDPALPWLLGVARNVMRDSFRAQARRESLVEELQRSAVADDFSDADIGETVTDRLALLGALAGLSEAEREALILVAWLGLTPGEAARVTASAPTAMRVRLHRARERLRRTLSCTYIPHQLHSDTPAARRGL